MQAALPSSPTSRHPCDSVSKGSRADPISKYFKLRDALGEPLTYTGNIVCGAVDLLRIYWILFGVFIAGQAMSDPAVDTNYNTYGYPGLIDMPTAHSRPDGELALSVSHFQNTTRSTLTFQMTPRLSGSFRYSNLYNIRGGNNPPPSNLPSIFIFDRSFSIHYRFIDETDSRPAIAVGLNDFFGTGIYSSEYFVATKTIRPDLRVTGGIGWGRLGGINSFTNPLALFGKYWRTRPGRTGPQGGTVQSQNWFRGDAALFGGVQWQATDRLLFTGEYSSDAYPNEDGVAFDRKIPFNFGVSYKLRPNTRLSANYLYGSELAVQLSIALNPKNPPAFSGYGKAPPPVVVRTPKTAAQLGWDVTPEKTASLQSRVATALADLGLRLNSFTVSETSARVAFEGATNITSSQSVGRIARALTGILPPSVEEFVIVLMNNGIAISQVTIQRSDLEKLEYAFDGSWGIYAKSRIGPVSEYARPIDARYPSFQPQVRPYLAFAWFDPDQPVRLDIGLEARAL